MQVAATAIDPVMFDPHPYVSRLMTPAHVLYWVSFLLLLIGLPGLHEAQAHRSGRLGAVGFLLALAGSAFGMAVAVVGAHVLPLIGATSGENVTEADFLRPGSPVGFLLPIVILLVLTFMPGYVILGVAALRAQVFPRWCAVLLIVGVVLPLAGAAGPIGRFIAIAGSLLLTASLAGFAYALWSGRAPAGA